MNVNFKTLKKSGNCCHKKNDKIGQTLKMTYIYLFFTDKWPLAGM